MTTPYECCPFHADEDQLDQVLADDGWHLTCPRTQGHPSADSTYTWIAANNPRTESEGSGLTAELGLLEELPAALATYRGQWVEYGVLEERYATARPEDFALLVKRYGHTAIKAKKYTASTFLGRALGELARTGSLCLRIAPATGRWTYNQGISWWSLDPDTPWEERVSWASRRQPMRHVPGSTEICPIGHCTVTDASECHCT